MEQIVQFQGDFQIVLTFRPTGDRNCAAVLPAGHSRRESLSVSLCLDALAIARREIDMRKVERGGELVDFEFRMHRDEPVRKAHTLEDFA